MTENKKKYWNGFWDKQDCKFRVVEAIVAPTPPKIAEMKSEQNKGDRRFEWYEMFVGKQLQMIEISHNNIEWFINNSDGKGLKKVSNMVGLNDFGHKGCYAEKIIGEVLPGKWITYNEGKEMKLNAEVEEYFMKEEPFLYPKHKLYMEELREIAGGGQAPANANEKKRKDGDDATVISIN